MKNFISFIFMIAAARAALSLLQFFLRKKTIRPVFRGLMIVAKALLAIALAALPMAGPVVLRPVQPLMMAAYVVFLADAAADLLYSVFLAIRKGKRSFGVFQAVSVCCCALFFLYGFLNMQIVKPKDHTYTSDKLTDTHKIVFAADIHVGSAQLFSTTQKTVESMKAQQPDCVILGGDIMDDYTTKEEMQQTFALFRDFGCPVYFVYGNHDLQGHAEYAIGPQYTQAEFEQTMKDNNVTLLKDDFVRLAPDVLILGRNDISAADERINAAEMQNPDPGAYLVVVDHQPSEFVKKNMTLGTDLQLSGHTHAGQLFPLDLLYSLIGYVYGDYEADGAVMNVSAGACGWRVPLRTAAHCNYEVITLQPAAE